MCDYKKNMNDYERGIPTWSCTKYCTILSIGDQAISMHHSRTNFDKIVNNSLSGSNQIIIIFSKHLINIVYYK